MDHSPQTRLEWMRVEFQDARRRRLVKTNASAATSRTNAQTPPPGPTVLIDSVATERPSDHPKAR
jgi:hypothetical protein